MGYLIGLDIGTSGTKAILLSEKGQIVASSHAEYGVDQPKPLWAQQDGEIWLDATCKVLRDLLFVGRVPLADIVGMAISGLYGGSGIPVDSQMNPLAPCLIWMDRRASRQVEWVKEHVHLERLYEITGNTVDSYYGFTKMMWVRDNWSDVWQKTAVFLPPNAWVIYKLTGEVAIDYSSAGNIGGIFDLGKRGWSDEMCSILGVPVSKQPERLVASSDIVGKLSPEGAALTGLLAGTPVVA
ncbi:FGGY family carbohydrate kinase, partial [Aminobacterium sp. UBA4834]